MTDCCDGSTWLDYMGNLVIDIRLETWSMAVLCRDMMQEHLKRCHLWASNEECQGRDVVQVDLLV